MRLLDDVVECVTEDRLCLSIMLGTILVGLLGSVAVGIPNAPLLGASWILLRNWTIAYSILGASALLVYMFVTERRSLVRIETWRVFARRAFRPGPMVGFALIFLLIVPFMTTFVGFKVAIPDLLPFQFDETFMRADRRLHLGHHPWELLRGLVGRPATTNQLDFVYYLWFPMVWIMFIAFAWHGRPLGRVRGQFLLAFTLAWILLGIVAALLLSSAGPVYYSAVTGQPGPYEDLMAYLGDVHESHGLRAITTQEMLWQAYETPGRAGRTEGISAMPSMHVSITVLLALAAGAVHRLLGAVFWLLVLVILVASVHLAWHYAIDGYVAIPATWVVWWMSGRLYDLDLAGAHGGAV